MGGVFGIPAAAYNELLHGSALVAFVGAPIIEESLKPAGLYLLLAKYPKTLRNRLYTAFLGGLGGLSFGLIESTLYVHVYYRYLDEGNGEPSPSFVLWRYTVCVGLHVLCSSIFALGINERLLASVKGETKFLSTGKRFFFTAIILHALYNVAAVVVEATMDPW